MIIICYRLIVFSAYWLLVVGGDEVFAIPWFSLKFLVFYNREKEPRSRAEANFGLRQSAGILPA